MPGLFPRIKVWGSQEVLTASDLNAEFDNILTNFIPTMMQGYSATVSQMQIQTNPGNVGTESLAANLSGELERIRFVLAEITGNTYWYTPPTASIASLNSALGANAQSNSITSGRTLTTSSQPTFLVPSGSVNSLTLKGSTTSFVYKVANTTVTISTDITVTSLTTAPTVGNTMVIDDATLAGASWTQLLGENGSSVTVKTMGAQISALTGQIAAFKTANSEYVIGRVQSATQLVDCFRGYFFQSNDTLFSRAGVTNGDTWTLMKLTWVYATTAGGLSVVYTNPVYSGTAPSSPATGDYWFDMVANIWKVYNSTSFVAANATLVGVCIQDSTKTVGARSFDFYKGYSSLNTCELFVESTTLVRSRYLGSQASVYGTLLQFGESFINWNSASNMDASQTFSANTFYYFYVTEAGNTVISSIAPFDRRPDLQGFYHPLNTWRCFGSCFSNGSTQFNVTTPANEIESFFRNDTSSGVSKITAATAIPYPVPYGVQFTQKIIECDASSGALTQILPPASQWRGNTVTFLKTDSSSNAITLQAFASQILQTTGNSTAGSTSVTSLAATTGLTTGVTYNVSGRGISPRTTATYSAGTTVTLSQQAYATITGATLTFSVGQTINGNFTTTLNTQGESVDVMSDGQNIFIKGRYIPSFEIYGGTLTITAATTAPTKSTTTRDAVWYTRVGNRANIRVEFRQTGTGTAGSGDYYFSIPGGLVVDTDTTNPFTGATSSTGNTSNLGSASVNDGTSAGTGFVALRDSTKVQFITTTTASAAFQQTGSGFYGLGAAAAYAANYTVPVLGWNT